MHSNVSTSLILVLCSLLLLSLHVKADDDVQIKYERWTGPNCNSNATEIVYLQDAQCIVDNSTLSHRVACFHHTWNLYYRYFADDTCTTVNATLYRNRIINATTCDTQDGFGQMWTCINATTGEPMLPDPTPISNVTAAPTSAPTSNVTAAPTSNPTSWDDVKIKYQRWTGPNCNSNATEIVYLQDAQCIIDNSTLSHRVACFHHTWNLYYRYFADDTCTTMNTTLYWNRIINATTCDTQEGFGQMWTCVNATTGEPILPDPTPISNATAAPTSAPTSAPTTTPTPTPPPTPIPGRDQNIASTTMSVNIVTLMIAVLGVSILSSLI